MCTFIYRERLCGIQYKYITNINKHINRYQKVRFLGGGLTGDSTNCTRLAYSGALEP